LVKEKGVGMGNRCGVQGSSLVLSLKCTCMERGRVVAPAPGRRAMEPTMGEGDPCPRVEQERNTVRISSRGEYGLRALCDPAQRCGEGPVSSAHIAARIWWEVKEATTRS